MNTSAKRPNRLEQALSIRDHVLPLLHKNGALTETQRIRYLVWNTGPWGFSLRMDRLPSPHILKDSPNSYDAAVLLQDLQEKRGGTNFDHALDIWRGPKVFLAEWNADTPGRLNVATFKRGTWEIALLAFSPQESA